MKNQNKSVLITGASKGIGKSCALHFARKGWLVFAGVRNPVDGEQLTEEGGEQIIPLNLDVTVEEDILLAETKVREVLDGRGLDGLVNNAGIAMAGPMEFMPMEDLRWQLEVNYFAQVAVTQAFMPLLRMAQGRIVNMSSVSGRFVYPFLGPYASSKFALEAFSDALRRELLPWGMRVSVIEPGSIDTPIWDTSMKQVEQIQKKFPPKAMEYYGQVFDNIRRGAMASSKRGLPAQKVADVVWHALTARRPRTRYSIGQRGRMMISLRQWLPDRWMDAVVKRILYSD